MYIKKNFFSWQDLIPPFNGYKPLDDTLLLFHSYINSNGLSFFELIYKLNEIIVALDI